MKISKMQASQNNSSTNDTPTSPIKIEITEQPNGEHWVQITPPLTSNKPRSLTREITPTSPGYVPASPPATTTATKAKRPGAGMSWTACYEDKCWVHRSDKDGAYYPQGPQQQPVAMSSGWEAQENSPDWGRKTPTEPKRQPNRGYQAKK